MAHGKRLRLHSLKHTGLAASTGSYELARVRNAAAAVAAAFVLRYFPFLFGFLFHFCNDFGSLGVLVHLS
eukprot:COSAG01_NODE_29875_length_627_cov_17.996212_2_plen_69_part_01